MANHRRPVSTRSSSSQSSGATLRSDTFFSSPVQSLLSNLEDVLVRGCLNEVNKSSSQSFYMPKKYQSPYAKTVTDSEGKHNFKPLRFGLGSCLQSAAVSRRSEFRDCSTHQTESVQSGDGTPALESNKSKPASNFCLASPSTRNRPVSAPSGQLRFSRKTHVTPVFKWQTWIIRATAYKNGTRSICAKIAAPTMKLLLEDCTEKLNLHVAAKRVFLADGTEALEPEDIPHDADVYASTGEPFLDPFKNIKAHLLLMKKVSWTMNGLAFPTDVKRGKTKSILSYRMKKRTEKSTVRILVFKNGTGQEGYEIIAEKDQMQKFLDMCTVKVNLSSPARWLYDMDGRRIDDLVTIPLLDKCLQNAITPLRGPAWVSMGEGFSPSGAKKYIHRILMALHQQLKSEKNYNRELDLAMNGHREEVTQKAILSMTKEEMYAADTKVNELIDELQTAIKSYKGQLSKLTPQLQAEQEQCATYIYQHIKKLPANTLLPQGLQLKVYENGRDTGEMFVYISNKDLGRNNINNSADIMQKVLQTVHQRLQGSADFHPSGLNLTPTRLFDERGKEIKNPLLLKNEQKIWVSYGEDYRSPSNPVLSLTFDCVAASEKKDGITVVYKTHLDPEVDLLPHNNWQACTEFPVNYTCENPQPHPEQEVVDAGSHFLQSKVDPQMVLHASVSMEIKSRKAGVLPRKKDQQDPTAASAWPLTNVWLITKTGMILSRTMPQICLAAGHPVTFNSDDGTSLGGRKLILQKRDRSSLHQQWGFGNEGFIYSKAYPELVLTFLEELNVKEVTQKQHCIRQGAWSTANQEAHGAASGEVLQNNVSIPIESQLSGPLDPRLVPAVPLGETKQLTVALVRKLEEKHATCSAQRWAIKHEFTSKPGQWKHSRVENPLWNKLTYMWPVLPSGELNEDFDWPIEGLLVPNSPPLKKPIDKKATWDRPVRVKVLKNGDCDLSHACVIVGPDVSYMQKKQNVGTEKKQKTKDKTDVGPGEDTEMKVYSSEFQQFLERCTAVLNLPSAARRLFDENGQEVFLLRNLERDQLVYVSCGDSWINPQLTVAEHKKRLLLTKLASDISLIRTYCAMCNPEDLVLKVCGDIAGGTKLSVNRCVITCAETDAIASEEETQRDGNDSIQESFSTELMSSHAKSHHKLDAQLTTAKYPWQQSSAPYLEENDSFPKDKDDVLFRKVEFCSSSSYQASPVNLEQIRYQEFDFRDGQLSSCFSPGLVLGVPSNEVHSGVEVLLMEKKPDDSSQRWIHREEERTFHLMSNPGLVLAVSMPKTHPGVSETAAKIPGRPVILQGYFFVSPSNKEKIMLCLACARAIRGRQELSKLPADSVFSCASGKESPLSPVGPFKCLNVKKTDLSTSEAQNTLRYLVEFLSLLLTENSMQTISQEISAARRQPSVKIIAYRNGAGCRDGQLIIASTFSMLLSMCTRRLELPRPACRLYTKNGTLMLTLSSLVAWAVNESLGESDLEEQHNAETANINSQEELPEKQMDSEKSKYSVPQVTPEELSHMDDTLLSFILKNPIEVWVSSGEPFISLDVFQKAERMERINWLKKEHILTDLNTMRHKIRHLQGRRLTTLKPAKMVPTKSPAQPVVVEGGWMEETPEETKLWEHIQQMETHLSEVQALQPKRHQSASTKTAADQKSLYSQPATKRVLVYLNGGRAEEGIFSWGQTIKELLDNCTSRLCMPQPAKVLYTCTGEQVKSWDGIERDMVLCVSAGEPFLSRKAGKQKVEIRANYARIRKQQGPCATDVVISPSKNFNMQVKPPDFLLALPSTMEKLNTY
ncbi:doublecortin domain-containing protein 1 isoform X2 [Rhinatrema bivittatum]|uniref:doublecortin domain-containing protein 1 isoform X2 n=1 Tax=Rhinatrema bivittatum TaxID=194408 RepID=UPI00112C1D75|nr:doublecortin domain-containing protein 1 isoform X2 [Rhinatrema bivittatum]